VAIGRSVPQRTCVGCRVRAPKTDLLRVVVAEVEGVRSLVPDPRSREPGRGASVHPVPECLALAERRRAFLRAFPGAGPLDLSPLRAAVARAGSSEGTPSIP